MSEREWFVTHWSYDVPHVADGNFTLRSDLEKVQSDKIRSGEYVMERPPKKPGGFTMKGGFPLCLLMLVQCADGSAFDKASSTYIDELGGCYISKHVTL